MKKLLIILLSALSLTALAQQKKVAVYVTGEKSGISKVLGDQLVAAFAKSGKYTAVERTSSFLAELSKEQSYQRSGAVSDNDIAQLGVQFGVNYVCVADISDVFGQKYVSARLIDVENAEVVKATNASSPLTNMDELLTLSSNITSVFSEPTEQEKAQAIALQQKQAEEKNRAKRENELQRQMDEGYIKLGSLYVTSSVARGTWNDAKKNQKNCRAGGYSDWRIPSQMEFARLKNIGGNDLILNSFLFKKNSDLYSLFGFGGKCWVAEGFVSDGTGKAIGGGNYGSIIFVRGR